MKQNSQPQEHRFLQVTTLFLLTFTAINPGVNITLGDVFLLLVYMSYAKCIIIYQRTMVFLSIAIGLLIAVSSVVHSGTATPGDLLDSFQAVFIFAVFIPLGWVLFRGLSAREWMYPLVLAGVVHGIIALIQVAEPNFRLPTQPEFGLGEFGLRPAGLAGNPNSLGLIATWTLPLALYLSMRSRSRFSHWCWAVAALVCGAGGIASFSKIGLLLIPAALLLSLIGIGGKRQAPIILFLGSAVIIAFILPGVADRFFDIVKYRLSFSASFGGRLEGVQTAWAAFTKWWIYGIGAGKDTLLNANGVSIHNQVIGIAVQFGVLAAVMFIAMKVVLVVEGAKSLHTPTGRALMLSFVLSELTLMVHPVYWMRAHYLPVLILMYGTLNMKENG